jgi:hypothetical protein
MNHDIHYFMHDNRDNRTARRIFAVVGGVFFGLVLGGGAAALVESLKNGATTVPLLISGLASGLGLRMVGASLVRRERI